jgi:hypothetical protein
MDKSLETMMRGVTVILNNLAAGFRRKQYAGTHVIDDQEGYRANHGDQKATEIQSRNASRPGGVERPAPTTAPSIPSMISRRIPSPVLLTISLAMKSATKPNRIQARYEIVRCL